jgi:hypothetical protein
MNKKEDISTSASPHEEDHTWEALLRGSIIAATSQKFYNYIALIDQKAQAMIIMNSIIIPLLLNFIDDVEYKIPASIALITAMTSILLSIMCIYPKRRGGRKPNGTYNHLHFGDIGRMREDQYLQSFMPIFNNRQRLSEEAVKDLHDVSRRIIIPKFHWLKFSYFVFFGGNLIALMFVLHHFWF